MPTLSDIERIKRLMTFKQFMLAALVNAGNEWTLVRPAGNLKQLAALHPQSAQRT